MKKLILPLAALALVAGCKAKEPAADATATGVATATTAAAVALPTLPANAKATVKPEGTYTNAGATLKLGADYTAEMTGADGKTAKGKWAWYSDGKRILLTADKSVYAVADTGLYKMANKDAPLSGFTAEQWWTKAP